MGSLRVPERSTTPGRHAGEVTPSRAGLLAARAVRSSTVKAATAGLFVIAVVTPMSLALPPVGKQADAASAPATVSGTGGTSADASSSSSRSTSAITPVASGPAAVPDPTSAAPPPTSTEPAPAATTSASTEAPPPPAPSSSAGVKEVLSAINTARSLAGLGPVVADDDLQKAAAKHNLAMAGANQLSHQLPSEDTLGARITAASVVWTYVAENVGVGPAGDGSAAAATQVALSLTQSMLAETPPDDGHRRNILSPSVTRVGLDVYVDPVNGKVWLTQDFAN